MQKNNNSILEGLSGKSQQEAISTPLDPALHHWNNRLEEWPSAWVRCVDECIYWTELISSAQANPMGQVDCHILPKKLGHLLRPSYSDTAGYVASEHQDYKYQFLTCISQVFSQYFQRSKSLLKSAKKCHCSFGLVSYEWSVYFWSLSFLEAINIQPLVHMSR